MIRLSRSLLYLLVLLGSAAGGCATHPKGDCGLACDAIEATTKIEYPSERLAVLKRIANRADLTTHEQTYLINAIYMGGFSSDRADALILLIENPSLTDEAREHLVKKLKQTRLLGRHHRRVVDALMAHAEKTKG